MNLNRHSWSIASAGLTVLRTALMRLVPWTRRITIPWPTFNLALVQQYITEIVRNAPCGWCLSQRPPKAV